MEFCVKLLSLPLWERGLKFKYAESLRNQAKVAPLVGAWIEISLLCGVDEQESSRSPCGSVD